MSERIIILDFGSQTTQLIARRLRDLNVYCEVFPYNKFPEYYTDIKGVIFSGNPHSVYDENAFALDMTNICNRFPVLGICDILCQVEKEKTWGIQFHPETFHIGNGIKILENFCITYLYVTLFLELS